MSEKDTILPDGLTCSDCAYLKNCERLGWGKPDNTECYWSPSKFVANPQKYIALRSAIADLQHSYDEAMLQYDMAQKRACNAESQLKEAELDALTLADELTDEQNPGFICQALKLHYARLARKEGE